MIPTVTNPICITIILILVLIRYIVTHRIGDPGVRLTNIISTLISVNLDNVASILVELMLLEGG